MVLGYARNGLAFIVAGTAARQAGSRIVGASCNWSSSASGFGTFALAEIVEREILHLVVVAAMVATVGLAMVGGDDHLIAGLSQRGRKAASIASMANSAWSISPQSWPKRWPIESSVQVCRMP